MDSSSRLFPLYANRRLWYLRRPERFVPVLLLYSLVVLSKRTCSFSLIVRKWPAAVRDETARCVVWEKEDQRSDNFSLSPSLQRRRTEEGGWSLIWGRGTELADTLVVVSARQSN
ncbi:hypothetical protein B0I35DRAFT_147188 [Stachybotrys elegans]|uniref:Uncharacterized protein n=1 Tax=Stachybotrys elegans TaxID=80388 RepID=A0A8K0SII7_9HYPO|nr:hypothetical protein B0I35DRAFT_147188 [Stachybotrys elegans]